MVTKCCGPSSTLMRSVAYPPRFLMWCVPATCVLAPKRGRRQKGSPICGTADVFLFIFPENVWQPSDLYSPRLHFCGTFLHQMCVGANSRSRTNLEMAGLKSQNVQGCITCLFRLCAGEKINSHLCDFSRLTCVFGANLKARGGEGNPTTSDEGRIPTAFHFRQGRACTRAEYISVPLLLQCQSQIGL